MFFISKCLGDIIISYMEEYAIFCARIDLGKMFVMSLDFADVKNNKTMPKGIIAYASGEYLKVASHLSMSSYCFFKTDYRLMQVKIITESLQNAPKGSILSNSL